MTNILEVKQKKTFHDEYIQHKHWKG